MAKAKKVATSTESKSSTRNFLQSVVVRCPMCDALMVQEGGDVYCSNAACSEAGIKYLAPSIELKRK